MPINASENDEQLLARLIEQHPDFAVAIHLTQTFTDLVRERKPDALDAWLQAALTSSLLPFERFAQGLQEDYAAVKAGVTLAVSNGRFRWADRSVEDPKATDVWTSGN
ncbi:MAG: hypothetical protein ACRCZS_21695 [Chroococcidiopsis sp.]